MSHRQQEEKAKKSPYVWRSPFDHMNELIDIAKGLFEACGSKSEISAVKDWLLSMIVSRGHFVPEEIYPFYVKLREWLIPEGEDVKEIVVNDLMSFLSDLDKNYKMLQKGNVAPGLAVHCLTRVMSQELWKGNSAGFIAIFNELYDMMGLSGKTDAWTQYDRELELKGKVQQASAEIVSIEAKSSAIDDEKKAGVK